MYDSLMRMFLIGFASGIFVFAAKWVWSRSGLRAEPSTGVAIGIAFWITVSIIRDLSYFVWIALALLIGSGAISGNIKGRQFLMQISMILAGAVVLAFANFTTTRAWLYPSFVGTMACFAVLIGNFEQRFDHPLWIPLIILATAGGIFVSVPDTESAIVLFGLLITAQLYSLVKRDAIFFGSSGMAVFAGAMIATVFEGGKGRPASILVALACLGIFIFLPALNRIFPDRQWNFSGFTWFLLHCCSIAIVVGFVRTTPSLALATVVTLIAILTPLSFAELLRRTVR